MEGVEGMRNEDHSGISAVIYTRRCGDRLKGKLKSVFGIAVDSSDVLEVGVAGTCEEPNSQRTEGGRVMY